MRKGTRAEALQRWLAALPKPCGVFVANDKTGEEVLGVCAALDIAVPQDVSVVGVDNLVYLCESTSPTLSSILMDHVGEGRAAAQLLDGWMESPNHRPPPSHSVPALRLVRRASSRAPCDRRVARALDFQLPRAGRPRPQTSPPWSSGERTAILPKLPAAEATTTTRCFRLRISEGFGTIRPDECEYSFVFPKNE